MYVYNTEKLKDSDIDKILEDGSAVDIRGDKDFLLSKDNGIIINGENMQYDFSLEEYIKDMYDDGDYIDLHFVQIEKNEAIDVLVESMYKTGKNESVSFAERIYNSESPNDEILEIIDECVLIELENRLKKFRKYINEFKKKVQNEGVIWK